MKRAKGILASRLTSPLLLPGRGTSRFAWGVQVMIEPRAGDVWRIYDRSDVYPPFARCRLNRIKSTFAVVAVRT